MKRLLKKICLLSAAGLLLVPSLFIVFHFSSHNQSEKFALIKAIKSEHLAGSTQVQNSLRHFSMDLKQRNDAKQDKETKEVMFPLKKTGYKECLNTIKDESQKLGFYELQPGNVICSAFLDFRFKEQAFIRLISFLPAYDEQTQLYCHFFDPESQEFVSSVVEIEELGTNLGYAYQGFLSTCELPDEIDSYTLCSVNISTEPEAYDQRTENTKVIPLYLANRKINTRTYSLCVPPISGHLSAERLVEFIELSQILGVSHITFYTSEVADDTLATLRYYEQRGSASILAWELPNYISANIQDNGQTTALNDCFYRNMERFDFVAFNGFDEFIVPLHEKTAPKVFEKINDEDVAGYCFQSFVFYAEKSENEDSKTPLFTQKYTSRARTPINTMSRCIANVKKVSSLDLNGITNPAETYYAVHNLEPSLGYVFHYEKCYGNCNDSHQDLTMEKYREELETRVNKTLNALRNLL